MYINIILVILAIILVAIVLYSIKEEEIEEVSNPHEKTENFNKLQSKTSTSKTEAATENQEDERK